MEVINESYIHNVDTGINTVSIMMISSIEELSVSVCLSVSLSVCLSVSQITLKVVDEFCGLRGRGRLWNKKLVVTF